MAVPDGSEAEVGNTVGAFAALPVVLTIPAGDILRVRIEGGSAGAIAAPDAGTVSVGPGESIDFCLRPEGCECPDGTNPGGGAALPAASPGEGAAAVGALDAGEVAVAARRVSLDEACTGTLVGVWTTTVSEAFAILSAPYGGGGPSCTGPFVVTFGEDGTFSTGFEATCTLVDQTGSGQALLSGTYTNDDETFTVDDVVGGGTMTMFGTTQPLPVVDGYRQGLSGPVPYSIDGDQLTYTFSSPDGNSFTFVLTRSA